LLYGKGQGVGHGVGRGYGLAAFDYAGVIVHFVKNSFPYFLLLMSKAGEAAQQKPKPAAAGAGKNAACVCRRKGIIRPCHSERSVSVVKNPRLLRIAALILN
jgi:hypothetical protein